MHRSANNRSLLLRCLLSVVSLAFIVTQSCNAADAGDSDTKEKLVVGVRVGPAIPSEEIANVYNVLSTDDIGTAYETAARLGYALAANGRIGLSNAFSVSGGVGFVRFPGQILRLTDSVGHRYDLTTSTIFVPITVGLSWLPIHSVLVPIVHAEAMFNYRKSMVSDGTIVADLLHPGMETEPRATRIGAQVGVTLELDLGLRPQIDISYAFTNLLGKEVGELDKNYLTISVGIVL